jgi:hypothetical protein
MKWLFGILFILSAFFEANIASYPLWIPLFLIVIVSYRAEAVFTISLIGGVLLDILLVRSLGVTGLLGLFVALLCFAYERKYQVRSLTFIVIASMLLCVIYCLVFAVPALLLKTIIIGLFSLPMYFIYVTAKLNDWV